MKSSGKYDYLLEQYPDYMSKEQMFKACHISKKTCTFLLRKGLVKCSDNHQATCRYKIKTVNVIRYLEKREKNPEYYKPPANFYRRNLHCLLRTPIPPAFLTGGFYCLQISKPAKSAFRNYFLNRSTLFPISAFFV